MPPGKMSLKSLRHAATDAAYSIEMRSSASCAAVPMLLHLSALTRSPSSCLFADKPALLAMTFKRIGCPLSRHAPLHVGTCRVPNSLSMKMK